MIKKEEEIKKEEKKIENEILKDKDPQKTEDSIPVEITMIKHF